MPRVYTRVLLQYSNARMAARAYTVLVYAYYRYDTCICTYPVVGSCAYDDRFPIVRPHSTSYEYIDPCMHVRRSGTSFRLNRRLSRANSRNSLNSSERPLKSEIWREKQNDQQSSNVIQKYEIEFLLLFLFYFILYCIVGE